MFDLEKQQAVATWIGGEKALCSGKVIRRPGRIICTETGADAVRQKGIRPVIVTGGVPTLNRTF